jgi:hypothetical protein
MLTSMSTDPERLRFVANHNVTLRTEDGDYLVHAVRAGGPSKSPKFYPVSHGRSANGAIDNAIARYKREHGLT